ncbi:MAG: DUF433 domain-containing protein [Bryobacteraceae bacterium]
MSSQLRPDALALSASQEQILADYPQLEPGDFLAVHAYADRIAE